jgi:crotonobetainyl-CoA:carnitine CoA-transferase CaiB-like acyl-CoA transferase
MASCGYDDLPDSPPIRGNGGQGFHTGAHYAAIGTLMAVYHRDITGEGQYVDASIHEACACTTEAAMPQYMYLKNVVRRQTGRHASVSPTPAWQYLCTDGRYVCAFGLPRTVSSYLKLLELMEAKGVAGNLGEDRYREAIASGDRTGPESQEIMAGIGRFIEAQTADEAYHAGQQIGLPWGLIRAPEETLDDPHLHDRGFFVEVEHPEMGRSYTYTGTPYIFSESPWRIRRRAPLLGEDNRAVYEDELGLSKEELVELYETGAI